MKAEIGRRIKRIRVARGLTQKELASQIGIDFTYIGKIERGEQLPSLKIFIKISDALSIPIVYFFQEEAAASATELSLYNLAPLVRSEEGRKLLKALRQVHEEDIPLIVEIIHVLDRHRQKKKRYEVSDDAYLKAAEEEAPYNRET